VRAGVEELAGLPGGVVPVAHTVDVTLLEAQCDARGRPMVVLDTHAVHDTHGFMSAVTEAFSLPGWFGRSWDAFLECLRDVPPSTVLVWDGWTDMARASPRDTEVAIEVMAESGLTVLMVNAPEDDEPAT
jgi:hypothetical protein